MKKIILVLFLLVIIIGGLFLPIQSGFILEDMNGKTLRFFPTSEKALTIGWYHSVELTPWKEIYRVTDDHTLSLESTVYKAYGAGTPDTEGDVELLSDGFIRITGIDREIPYYSLLYTPESRYYIEFNHETHELKDYVSDYTNVNVVYQSLTLYEWLKQMIF